MRQTVCKHLNIKGASLNASVNRTTMHLRPSEIRFTQCTISDRFRKDSEHSNYQIGETLDDLLRGQLNIDDIPLIQVFKEDGIWYTHDNRRLWVFQKFETLGECTEVPVQRVGAAAREKRTTLIRGLKVKVKGDPGGKLWKEKEATIGGKSKPFRASPKSHNKKKSQRERKRESMEFTETVDEHSEYSNESESTTDVKRLAKVTQQENTTK